MNHALLTESAVRRPGQPPSSCRGELRRVSPEQTPVAEDAPAFCDDAQAGEGALGQTVEVRLWKCIRCGTTLVVASCPDGLDRLRNDYETPSR